MRDKWSNPRTRHRTKLTCHMCSVHEGYGRTIKVIGMYSICNWCFENIIPEFTKAFEPEADPHQQKLGESE